MPDPAAIHAAEFRRCLLDVDVPGVRRLWRQVSPHLPQPADDNEVRATLHRARTQAESVPLRARLWSHAWLLANGYPSGMPDELLPRGERLGPRVVEGVGIACRITAPAFRPAGVIIRKAMEDVVLDEYSGAVVKQDRLKGRMQEARVKVTKQLFGRLTVPRPGE